MNWKRGFIRAWIAFSVPWSVFFAWEGYDGYRSQNAFQKHIENWVDQEVKQRAAAEKGAASWEDGDFNFVNSEVDKLAAHRKRQRERYERAIVLGPAVPIALAIFGISGTWIARGFKK
jgi:uncharacterized membrane protein YcjF (UPF0283 family)